VSQPDLGRPRAHDYVATTTGFHSPPETITTNETAKYRLLRHRPFLAQCTDKWGLMEKFLQERSDLAHVVHSFEMM